MAAGSAQTYGNAGLPDDVRPVFNPNQALRLDRALTEADRATGLRFSVYVGEMTASTRTFAEALLARLGEHSRYSVVIAVSPDQRIVEVVTGTDAKRVLNDRSCGLAVVSMTSAFAAGDFAGGLCSGLDLLREQSARS